MMTKKLYLIARNAIYMAAWVATKTIWSTNKAMLSKLKKEKF